MTVSALNRISRGLILHFSTLEEKQESLSRLLKGSVKNHIVPFLNFDFVFNPSRVHVLFSSVKENIMLFSL